MRRRPRTSRRRPWHARTNAGTACDRWSRRSATSTGSPSTCTGDASGAGLSCAGSRHLRWKTRIRRTWPGGEATSSRRCGRCPSNSGRRWCWWSGLDTRRRKPVESWASSRGRSGAVSTERGPRCTSAREDSMSDLRSKLSRTAEDFEPSTDWLDAVLRRAHRRRRNRRVGAGLVSLAVFGAAFAGVWIGFSGGSSQPAAAPCTPEVIDFSGPALPSDASMTAAAAVSPDDAWAVGPADRGEVPVGGRVVVWHWNGESWEVVPSPSPETGPQATDTLVAVAALGPGDAWAVGEADPQQGLPRTEAARVIVEHWDGTAWSVVDAPSPSSFESGLTGVAAIAADDVWAVGFEVEGTIAKPLAEHWDGRRWSIAETPEVTRGDGNGAVLEAVTALAADDAWAVGSTAANPLIEHWDGSSWSVVEAPGLPAGTADGLLRAVAASGPDDVWAVG